MDSSRRDGWDLNPLHSGDITVSPFFYFFAHVASTQTSVNYRKMKNSKNLIVMHVCRIVNSKKHVPNEIRIVEFNANTSEKRLQND